MDLTKEINSLKLLPNHDKDYLLMHVGDGYVAVQNALKNLSIFSR